MDKLTFDEAMLLAKAVSYMLGDSWIEWGFI